MTKFTLPKWRVGVGATAIDTVRNYVGEEPDGFAVYSRNRDSGILVNSNYDCILSDLLCKAKELNADNAVYIHSFSHWGFGWGETIVILSGSPQKLIDYAEIILVQLRDYPIYDDSDFSQREDNACHKYWDEAGAREHMRIARLAGEKEPLRFSRMSFRSLCTDSGNVYNYLRDIVTG